MQMICILLLHKVHLVHPIIETCPACNVRARKLANRFRRFSQFRNGFVAERAKAVSVLSFLVDGISLVVCRRVHTRVRRGPNAD